MIGSRKGRRNALFGFLLIMAVVMGGMGWATYSRIRLADFELKRDRADAVQRKQREFEDNFNNAILQLENVIVRALGVENNRDYTDYLEYAYPTTLIGEKGDPIPPGRIMRLSPLAIDGPREEWIELYFQFDPLADPAWTSPQCRDLSKIGAEQTYPDMDGITWAQGKLNILEQSLSHTTIQTTLTKIYRTREQQMISPETNDALEARAYGDEGHDGTNGRYVRRVADGQAKTEHCPEGVRELHVRAAERMEVYKRTHCEREDIWLSNRYNLPIPDDASAADSVGSSEIEQRILEPLWYTQQPDGSAGLAFVREIRNVTQGTSFYQGFTVNWDRLRPDMLRAIDKIFPHADLRPVEPAPPAAAAARAHGAQATNGHDESEAPVEASAELPNDSVPSLPVRLIVDPPKEPPPVRFRAVLASVGGELAFGWGAAIAVLVAAGIGFRNLVAMTERRLQFAYAVTHELRTPLTTFQLYSDMLAADLVPDESKREYLETLNKESKRLSDLVESVLEYARLENHKVRLNPTKSDGHFIMNAIRETVEHRCKRYGVELIEENAVEDDQIIEIDVELMQQIAAVLVNNACRHATDRPNPKVHLRLAMNDADLVLDVIDSGHGVDRRDARHIFKPFRRGHSADSHARGGIGLGLSLARMWAKLLGGRLELVARRHAKYGGAHLRLVAPQVKSI